MNDLKIMFRVLLLGLFVWLTLAFPLVFTVVFWALFIVLGYIGWKEAKVKQNQRISDAMDELREMQKVSKEFGTPFDENLYKGDEFPEPHMSGEFTGKEVEYVKGDSN